MCSALIILRFRDSAAGRMNCRQCKMYKSVYSVRNRERIIRRVAVDVAMAISTTRVKQDSVVVITVPVYFAFKG